MITVLAKLKALPGKEAELAEACSQLAKDVQAQEEGCLMYIAHVSIADPSEIVMFEKYKDEAASNDHRHSPHFKVAGRKLKDLLMGPPQLEILTQL